MLVPDPGTQGKTPTFGRQHSRSSAIRKRARVKVGVRSMTARGGTGDRDRKAEERGLWLFLICQLCLLWGTLKEDSIWKNTLGDNLQTSSVDG